MRRAWLSLILASPLAGCIHYAPAPPYPERYLAAIEVRRLDEKPAGAVWSAADLLTNALARNPQVAEARARHATAVAAARTARLAPAMTLTLTAEYADQSPRRGGGAAAEIPLDSGVRRSARMTVADLGALQAWYDYGEATWAVRTALTKAQIDLKSAQAEMGLADQAVVLRRERLFRLERRVAAGEDDRLLALNAQTELLTAERRVSDAQGRREQAVVALATALGVGPDAARDLVLALPPEPSALDGLAAWRRDAVLSRSDILRAIADYDLAESALRLEVARQYPEVRVGPGYTYDHGVNKLPFNLSLALPTYDLNRRAIVQAEAARTASGRSLERAQANAMAQVDTAVVALATARATLDRVTARDLPAARRTAANAARSVQAGAADRVDELAARAAERDAELNLLDARRAVRTAVADLEEALRRSFDPAETAVLQTTMTQPGGTP